MTDSVRTANATTPSRRARLQPRVLEPRVLLDAAAVETAVAVAADASAEPAPVVDTSALFDAPATTGRREAYVVDTSVEGYEGLLSAVPEGAELFLIDGSKSGLAQLNEALDSVDGQFDAIHVISHGTGGALKLGADTITASNVGEFQAALNSLGSHIARDGDLLLYGCNIAGNSEGTQLLDSLASITGADVAASTDATGGLNGDGELEAWAGNDGIQTDPWAAVAGLDTQLALEGYDAGEEVGDTGGGTGASLGVSMDSDGDWVVAGSKDGTVRVWNAATLSEQIITDPNSVTAGFGRAVAIDGNTIIVADANASGNDFIHVYRLTGSTWNFLRSIDVNAEISGVGGEIGGWPDATYGGGQWLDISGNHIVIGVADDGQTGNAQGRVIWMADTSGGSWTNINAGRMDGPDNWGGMFGASVAIKQGVFVVGGPLDDGGDGIFVAYRWDAGVTGGPNTGPSVTTYLTDGSSTRPTELFKGSLGDGAFYMGAALDIGFYNDRYTLVVGAPGENGSNGEIYVYQTGVGNLTFGGAYNLHTRDGDANNYGVSIKVKDNKILVGAAGGNGAVFLYTNSAANNAWGTGDTSSLPSGVTETVTVGSTGDAYGRSVAFAGSNGYLVAATGYGNDDRGAVYTYGVTGLADGSILASNGGQQDQLGYAVDAYGEWVVAGGNGNGEVQVWRVFGDTRVEQKIAPPSGSSSAFGAAVSIDGNTFVVGDPNAGSSGKVFVYQLNTGTMQWGLVKTLDVSGVSGWTSTDRIGRWANASQGGNQWLAVSENRIAVGAPNEGGNTGRVAWFADTSNSGSVGNWSTVASGFFDEPAPASYGSDGATAPRFGASIAMAGDALVIGAPTADTEMSGGMYSSSRNGSNHGAVFVFQWSRGSVTAPTTATGFLLSGEADTDGIGNSGGLLAAEGSGFGAAVDVDYYNPDPDPLNNPSGARYTIVAGAPGENGGRGEIYIYQTTSNSLTAFTAASNIYGQTTDGGIDSYGLAVAVSQGRIVVGAPNHDTVTDAGVFFYEKADNVWTALNTNNPSAAGVNVLSFTAASYGGVGNDRFGRGVAFSNGNNIAAGAPLYSADDRGAVAFFYARTPVAVNDNYTIGEDSGVVTFTPTGKTGSNDIFGTETDVTVEVIPVLPSGIKGTLVWSADSNSFTYTPKTDSDGDGDIDANDKSAFDYLSAGQTEVISLSYQLKTLVSGTLGQPDAKYFFSNATVRLTINGVNDAPVVDAGIANIIVPLANEPNGNPSGAQTLSVGSVVLPFYAFSDIDQADILTYSALPISRVSGAAGGAGTAATLPGGKITVAGSYNKATGENTGAINYDLSGLDATYEDTVWRVTVQANDGNGGLASTTFDFTIGRSNQNPEKSPITAPDATEDVVYTFDLDPDNNPNLPYFSDPDILTGPYAEKLVYTLVSQTGPGSDWLSISGDGVLSGAPTNENVGNHSVVVRVTDFFGNTIDSDPFTITVANTNDAPVLVNAVDRKVSIKGESFSFNVDTGTVTWNAPQPTDPLFGDAGPYFVEIDNSTDDGRSPSAGDTITYTAYNAVDNAPITTTGTGGTAGGTNDLSWLSFNGTTFSGTSSGALGSIVTVRLRATDNHGAFTETVFEIGIFPRDGSATESTPLPTPEYAGQLGYDVAINSGTSTTGQGVAGKWAVVGAPGENGGNGRIYIYENTAANLATGTPEWTLRGSPFTTIATYARLGASVAISADGMRIVAGAPNEDTNGADDSTNPATIGSQQGAIYYYVNDGSGVWSAHTTAKSISPDADNGDHFGSAVALNENGAFVLVGAPTDDEAGTNAGAAYAFGWGAGTAGGKILPTLDANEVDTASVKYRAGDLFGTSVAFDENMLVIGAPRDDHSGKTDAGSVYVISTDSTWNTIGGQYAKLTKAAADVGNYDYFGTSVDVDSFSGRNSVVVVVGTPKDDLTATDAGAVYVFRSDSMVVDGGVGSTGGLTSFSRTRVAAYDATRYAEFGYSVAVDADEQNGNALRMAVGGNLNAASTGATYGLRWHSGATVNSGWLGQRFLPATDATNPENMFGYAVDVAAAVYIAGAPHAERTGGASSTDLGTFQPMAGKFYGFNSRAVAGTPIEQLSSAAPIAKSEGSDQPSPVILASGPTPGTVPGIGSTPVGQPLSGLAVALLGDGRDDEWERLLRPVTDWAPTERGAAYTASGAMPLAGVSSYSEAVLFDLRTEADNDVLAAAKAGEQLPQAPEEAQPAEQEESGEAVPADVPLASLLRGFSTQLEAANGARARDARQLLVSLESLAS